MPINVDSEEWKESRHLDPLEVHITDFLRHNEDLADDVEELQYAVNNLRRENY
jgi:hypothetical protein